MTCFRVCIVVFLSVICATNSVAAQKTNDKYNAILDIANTFFQEKGDMTGIAQAIGSLMKKDASKSGGGLDAVQILSGINQLINANNDNANGASELGGFDQATIKNVIDMFTTDDSDDREPNEIERQKRQTNNLAEDTSIDIDSILNVASVFMNNLDSDKGNDGSKNLLPMAIQMMTSFEGLDTDNLQSIFKQINELWNLFANPELTNTMWEKMGIKQIFKGFYDRDGQLNYEKLFNSLNNQSYRRQWLKSAVAYLSEWANYMTQPDVYKRYSTSAQFMFNGILAMQEVPPHALFDENRPSESVANLFDFIAHKYLHRKISTIAYVKPVVTFIRDLMELGVARDLLQKLNTPKLNDKFIDVINLEVIEPVLKVYRAFRFASRSPQCDKYVLCKVNSHNPRETLDLDNVKAGITKLSSMAAAWSITKHTGTPFWTLLNVIFESHNCKVYYREECSGFHEEEEKVTMDYIHNEL